MLIMLVPASVAGFSALMGSFPDTMSPMFINPWMHSLGILNKVMYPQTFANSTITGSIGLDLILHLSYLLIFVIGSLLLSAKIFDREAIVE